ncbi:hypothetical protein, partial [Okeania sp. SIO2B9]|uniref:hypothetical protein n=1 Tax=Okeania sp. SIO2B9 TaxID=2607782 RepID=UPI00257E4479
RQLAIRGVGPWLGAGLLFLNIMAPDGTFDLAAARRTIRQACGEKITNTGQSQIYWFFYSRAD